MTTSGAIKVLDSGIAKLNTENDPLELLVDAAMGKEEIALSRTVAD